MTKRVEMHRSSPIVCTSAIRPARTLACMEHDHAYRVEVDVATRYLDRQSEPERSRYVFAYTIDLHNTGSVPAQLVARHWVITDANGKVHEVTGEGVIGQQPWLQPGEHFRYTSGAVLETDLGLMQGSYAMLAEDGTEFQAPVPVFALTVPRTLH
jgi:ApaG protein